MSQKLSTDNNSYFGEHIVRYSPQGYVGIRHACVGRVGASNANREFNIGKCVPGRLPPCLVVQMLS